MQRRFWIAIAALGAAIGFSGPTLASPPQRQHALQELHATLDLRAPSHVIEASVHGFATAHRQSFNPESISIQEPKDLAALGADGMRSRPRIQDFVRRVRQEGLPVARLFESKSALVHLGLSPKGKPGLWLVQKIH